MHNGTRIKNSIDVSVHIFGYHWVRVKVTLRPTGSFTDMSCTRLDKQSPKWRQCARSYPSTEQISGQCSNGKGPTVGSAAGRARQALWHSNNDDNSNTTP